MSECVSEISWCFFKHDYLLFASKKRLMEMFILSTQSIRFGEKLVSIVVVLLFSWKYVLFAQKRRLVETFLWSTQSKRFGGK